MARKCTSSFEPKCHAGDHKRAYMSGVLPMGVWDADNCTGSRLSAFQPMLVFGFVSPTPGPVPLIAIFAMQRHIKNPPWGSQCITCLEGIVIGLARFPRTCPRHSCRLGSFCLACSNWCLGQHFWHDVWGTADGLWHAGHALLACGLFLGLGVWRRLSWTKLASFPARH